ncbi:MAG: hypothetical protein B7Y95_07600 [Rhizobiales bacterium 32-66-11]|nr:MAG: hypothetical protein B7Y95_07600 [Rhizobiales bacterium 32-66-11]
MLLWERLSIFWRAQFIGWGLFAIVDLGGRQLAYENIYISMVLTVVVCPTLMLLSAGLRHIYLHSMSLSGLTIGNLAKIAILSTGCALLVTALLTAIRAISGWNIPGWGLLEEVIVPLIHYAFVFTGWSILFFWVRAEAAKRAEHQRATAAEADALRAEILQLRVQIDPHFLFNALNGVTEELAEGTGAALGMMQDVTAYLRHSLAGIHNPIVTVAEEMASISAYLAIQQGRFGDRLTSFVVVDPYLGERPIAHFLLLPLIENAIIHGDRRLVLSIGIHVSMQHGALRIEVVNTGHLQVRGDGISGAGVGLGNVRRRLEVHYPERHHFSLHQAQGRVVAVLLLEGDPCSGH